MTRKGTIGRGLAVLAALLVVGCGSTGAGVSKVTPTPAPTATRPPAADVPLVATLEFTQNGNGPRVLHLSTTAGREVARVRLRGMAVAVKVAANSVYYIDDATLRRVDRAGNDTAVTKLAALPGVSDWGIIAVRGDGDAWAWSSVTTQANGVHTRLYAQERGGQARLLMEVQRDSSHMRPVRWTKQGLLVESEADGVGGYPVLFQNGYVDELQLLDPATGTARMLANSGKQCELTDVGDDLAVACIERTYGSGPRQADVVVRSPGGGSHRLHVPGPTYQVGNAALSPDGRRIEVGVNHTDETDGPGTTPTVPGHVVTYVIDVASGKVQATQPDALPGGWTPDGQPVFQHDVMHDDEGIVVGGRGVGVGTVYGILSPKRSWSPFWT